MRVEILRDTVAGGRPVFAGSVYDLDERTARILIALDKARPAPRKARSGGRKAGS